jgi:hypothetical protein
LSFGKYSLSEINRNALRFIPHNKCSVAITASRDRVRFLFIDTCDLYFVETPNNLPLFHLLPIDSSVSVSLEYDIIQLFHAKNAVIHTQPPFVPL